MWSNGKIRNACLPLVLTAVLCLEPCPAYSFESNEPQARSLAAYTMGVVYDLQGLTEEAIVEFNRSAELADNYAAHLRLGADYARLGELPVAIDELNKVLSFDVNNVQARYLLALIYSTRREYDKAAREYESILTSFSEADPQNIEIYGYLAQLYYSQKKFRKAIKQFETILSIDKTNVDVMFLLGCLYLDVSERDKAVDVLSRAVLIDPFQDTALNSLGYIYAEDGVKLDEAQELIERALEIAPGNGAYLDSLGWVYYKKGEYAQALRYLLDADLSLDDPVVYEHLGDVYLKLDDLEKAKYYWGLSLQLLPGQDQVTEKLNAVD